jgi:hypothetical protein
MSSEGENLRKQVDNFFKNKNLYKVDTEGQDTYPDPKDLKQGTLGAKLYNNIAEAYKSETVKDAYKNAGFETPTEYKDFLKQGRFSSAGADIHNEILDKTVHWLQMLLRASRVCLTLIVLIFVIIK